MSKFITSFTSQIMTHKLNTTVQIGKQDFKVKAIGSVTGSRLDAEANYDNLQFFWDGKNVTEIIDALNCEDKILKKVDEELFDLHFGGEFAQVEEYETMYVND